MPSDLESLQPSNLGRTLDEPRARGSSPGGARAGGSASFAASFADGVANFVTEADPAPELRESIEVGVKWAQTAADQGE